MQEKLCEHYPIYKAIYIYIYAFKVNDKIIINKEAYNLK